MEKRVLVLQHNQDLEPFLLGRVLEEERVVHDVVDVSRTSQIPPLENYDALMGLGGWGDVPDVTPEMLAAKALVQDALRDSVPSLLICLSSQLGAVDRGAHIVRKPVDEKGFRRGDKTLRTVQLTEDGKRSPLFADTNVSVNFNLNNWMIDPQSLDDNVRVLAYDANCPVQATQLGPMAYGIQWHPEIGPNDWEEIVRQNPGLIEEHQAKIQSDFIFLNGTYEVSSRQIFVNFLKEAGLLGD